jgi:hypothetical protein
MLRATRGARAKSDLGRYYIVNFMRSWIVAHDVDPEAVGRELGVLEDYEQLVEDEGLGRARSSERASTRPCYHGVAARLSTTARAERKTNARVCLSRRSVGECKHLFNPRPLLTLPEKAFCRQ